MPKQTILYRQYLHASDQSFLKALCADQFPRLQEADIPFFLDRHDLCLRTSVRQLVNLFLLGTNIVKQVRSLKEPALLIFHETYHLLLLCQGCQHRASSLVSSASTALTAQLLTTSQTVQRSQLTHVVEAADIIVLYTPRMTKTSK